MHKEEPQCTKCILESVPTTWQDLLRKSCRYHKEEPQ